MYRLEIRDFGEKVDQAQELLLMGYLEGASTHRWEGGGNINEIRNG